MARMTTAGVFTLQSGRGALAHIRTHRLAPTDVARIPAAAGGPKGRALLPLDKLLHREWLSRASSIELIGASIGAWRVAALAQPAAAAARDRRQYAQSELAFGRAVLGNAVSRNRLAAHLQRVLFQAGEPSFLTRAHDAFDLVRMPLQPANEEQALLASGTILLLCAPVRDLPGAPPGNYRDGALVDYHLLLPYAGITRAGPRRADCQLGTRNRGVRALRRRGAAQAGASRPGFAATHLRSGTQAG